MKFPKIRELIEAIKALIKGPYTSDFPKKTHEPHPNFRGRPKFNDSICVGCLACEMVCPVGAIDHKDVINENGESKRVLIHYSDICIFCGECEAACIANNEGIKLSDEWDLAFFDREKETQESIEKELLICELCGDVITCRDHLIWISDRLGELTYSSPTLYLSRLQNLGIIDNNIKTVIEDKSRSDRTKILCAECRRKTTLTTEE